ncbi:hypothetical protein O1611_g10493 [Lasiodiplodia mahajangana]|uniref:Uncharacterized protein n=1 Tax=Lasiodiplodia mahajangana TaxID=1108764 RepID=A0ACC2IXK9_9PEZI|nr:hypothetical protein O1611_g10493 [Lasiodiplodia mahajangana]
MTAATEDPILEEEKDPIVVTTEENMSPEPATEVAAETETEADQQGIDFVTLGMFIIARSSSYNLHRPAY